MKKGKACSYETEKYIMPLFGVLRENSWQKAENHAFGMVTTVLYEDKWKKKKGGLLKKGISYAVGEIYMQIHTGILFHRI